ncbi:MAG: hypothetical protein ACJ8AT_34530 [Hyalangium sp.]|uniref:hypothetical protein n=1 Tax=Hyalangium sp. TaxID=2028555 RepID=UPI00389ABD01
MFPQFFEQEAVQIGADERPYELDGAMLRALMVATNDFLPEDDHRPPCRSGQALKYRVLRQGEIIFISLEEDLSACGVAYAAADSGAKYAISTDGRILRRVVDGQPMQSERRDTPDAGHHAVPAGFGTSAVFDGGVNPDGGSSGAP